MIQQEGILPPVTTHSYGQGSGCFKVLDPGIFERGGVRVPQKGRSVGIFKLTSKKEDSQEEEGLDPLNLPPGSATDFLFKTR